MNNEDVLTEYFGQFGPLTSLRINHNRHEAVVAYSRPEDAMEALKWPVLNDTSIGLRPWRSKPPGAPNSHGNETHGGGGGNQANGGGGAAGAGAENRPSAGNMQLESGSALEKKRKRDEIEEKRKLLLQGLTDQLKAAMARISDPKMTEKNREKIQVLLTSIKEKITSLTPKIPEPEPPRQRWPPSGRMGYPGAQFPGAERHAKPVTLRLTNLPAEMRGAEAEAKFSQTLGEGVESVRSWSEDGGSCVVRFVDRRHAEAALQAQKVWGYTAEWVEEPPEATTAAMAAAVAAPAEDEAPLAPASVETEAMDSDMDDEELAGAMESAAQSAAAAQAAAANGATAAAPVAEAAHEAQAEAPAASEVLAAVAEPAAGEAAAEAPAPIEEPALAEALAAQSLAMEAEAANPVAAEPADTEAAVAEPALAAEQGVAEVASTRPSEQPAAADGTEAAAPPEEAMAAAVGADAVADEAAEAQ